MINDFFIGTKPQSSAGMDYRNLLLESGIPLEKPTPEIKYLEVRDGYIIGWSEFQYPPYDIEYDGNIEFDFKYNEYEYKKGKINVKPKKNVDGAKRIDVETMLIMRDIDEMQAELNSTVDDAIAYLDGEMSENEYLPIRKRRNELRAKIKDLQHKIEI